MIEHYCGDETIAFIVPCAYLRHTEGQNSTITV